MIYRGSPGFFSVRLNLYQILSSGSFTRWLGSARSSEGGGGVGLEQDNTRAIS